MDNRAIPTRAEVLHPAVVAVAAAALGVAPPRAAADGAVALQAQARLLAELLERQGPEGVLMAGRHLDVSAREPIVLALLTSEEPGVLLDKVDRLNRFLHSSHRHVVRHLDGGHAEIEHVSVRGAPPSPVESLFVCGLYLELLARIGCRGLGCAFPEAVSGARDVYRGRRPVGVPAEGTGRWDIRWAGFEPATSLPGIDDVLLRDLPADLTERSTSARVEAVVRADLARTWRVGDVADRLATSSRTLQRHLGEEGSSFTSVVTEARVAAARDLLADTDRTVTDIGYLTGFADTAHFTRTFRRATGESPGRWRAQLAGG